MEYGGMIAVGDGGCGSAAVGALGRVANLDVREGELGTAEVSLEHEWLGVGLAAPVRILIAVDGEVQGELPGGGIWSSGPLADGGHEVRAVIVGSDTAGTPVLAGELLGRRVRLSWAAVADADLVAYRIYSDAGDGLGVDTLLDEVSVVESEAVVEALPTTGTGTGRITIEGQWRGATVNQVWAVEVTAAGEYGIEVAGGGLGADAEFRQGARTSIGEGLRVVWLDPAADYDVGDRWEWRVGPRRSWTSVQLAAGTYAFEVRGVDAAGNEGDAAASVSVAVAPGIDPVTGLSASVDGSEVTVSWTDASGAARNRVYANWDPLAGALTDYVDELRPQVDVAALGGGGTWVLDLGAVTGELLVYVRGVDAAGNEDGGSELLRVRVPAQATTLGAPPVIVDQDAATPTVTVEWVAEAGASLPSGVELIGGSTEDFDPEAGTVFGGGSWSSATGWPVMTLVTPASDMSSTLGDFTWVRARLYDGSGVRGEAGPAVAVVGDATPPADVTGLSGVVV